MVHAPAATIVTSPAGVTVQAGEIVAKLTAKPELAVAVTVKLGSPNFLTSADTSNVIVWLAFPIVMVDGTSAAARKFVLPACEATIVRARSDDRDLTRAGHRANRSGRARERVREPG